MKQGLKSRIKSQAKFLTASFALATGAFSVGARAQELPSAPVSPATVAGMLVTSGYSPVAEIRVDKSDRRLELLDNKGDVLKSYKIALGKDPVGDKKMRGDNKTPEGRYTIDWQNPESAYTLSLRISYPNAEDKAEARTRGVNPGGDIFIHGAPTGFSDVWTPARADWTQGCIAVNNNDMREIYGLVKPGTPITIKP